MATTPQPLRQEGLFKYYDDLHVIAAGGGGIVFRAHDRNLGRIVAVKLLLPSQMARPAARVRALREARAMAAVNHPNVVYINRIEEIRLTDADDTLLVESLKRLGMNGAFPKNSTTILIEMEWISGGSLQDRITRGEPFTQSESARILLEVLDALKEVHARGIVHRDIKAANILLTEDGTAKVSDFGLVNSQGDARLTRDDVMMGTPGYMAPEQARDAKSSDCRADLYAAGVVFHCLLRTKDPIAVPLCDVPQRMKEYPDDPTFDDFWRDIDPQVQEFIIQATQADRDQRFASAEEMSAGLGQVSGNLLVSLATPATIIAPEDPFSIPSPPRHEPVRVSDQDDEEDWDPLADDDELPPRKRRPLALALTLLLSALALGGWLWSAEDGEDVASATDAPPMVTVEFSAEEVPTSSQQGEKPISGIDLSSAEPPRDGGELKTAVVHKEPVKVSKRPTQPRPEVKPAAALPADPPAPKGSPLLITVSGDAEGVWLKNGTFHKLPATLPEGDYQIFAQFPGGERTLARTDWIRVEDGVSMRIVCMDDVGCAPK